MKSKIASSLVLALLVITLFSCNESTAELGGAQSEFGEVGVKATSYNLPQILQNCSAEITELSGGVSVLTLTADFLTGRH